MLKFRATKYAITVCGLTSIALLFVFFFPPRNPHTETLKPALVEIQFHDITNLPQAKQKYPFSENAFNDIEAEKLSSNMGSEIFISDRILAPDGRDFYILHIRGPLACGTKGCSTSFFSRVDGKHYKEIPTSFIANIPIYKKLCLDRLSIVPSPGGGFPTKWGEWSYQSTQIKFSKNHASLQAAAECQQP